MIRQGIKKFCTIILSLFWFSACSGALHTQTLTLKSSPLPQTGLFSPASTSTECSCQCPDCSVLGSVIEAAPSVLKLMSK